MQPVDCRRSHHVQAGQWTTITLLMLSICDSTFTNFKHHLLHDAREKSSALHMSIACAPCIAPRATCTAPREPFRDARTAAAVRPRVFRRAPCGP
jgi:hypothetical protein